MNSETKWIALLSLAVSCGVFADEARLPCPPSEAAIDPTISVKVEKHSGRYIYHYNVTYKVGKDALSVFMFDAGMQDFDVVSTGGGFKNCRRTAPNTLHPTGNGLACLPAFGLPGQTWEGNFALSSPAAPGVWSYQVHSIHIESKDEAERLPSKVEEFLATPSGDEVYQEAALEQCGPRNAKGVASRGLSGATIAPTGILGISPDALRKAVPGNVGAQVEALIGKSGKGELSTSTHRVSTRLFSSAGDEIANSGVLADISTDGSFAGLRCNTRGIFLEVKEGERVVAREAWQIDAVPGCASSTSRTMVVDVP